MTAVQLTEMSVPAVNVTVGAEGVAGGVYIVADVVTVVLVKLLILTG